MGRGRTVGASVASEHPEHAFAIAMFNASPLPSALVRRSDLRFVLVNDAYVECFGWTREDMLVRAATDTDGYADAGHRDRLVERIVRFATERNIEVHVRRATGEVRIALVSVQTVAIDDEDHALVVLNDITDRMRSEEALKASEARFATAFMKNPLPAAIVRLSDSYFLDVNEAFLALFGYRRDELVGRPATLHRFWQQPAARAAVYARFAAEGKVAELPVRMLTKRGESRDVLWSMEHVSIADDACAMCIMQDITDRKHLEDQLRQTQKLESLGMLAGGVAHDFNNILAVIASCNSLLIEQMGADDPDRELVDEIDAAVVRASSLTRQLLAFSRKQVTDPKVVELNSIVNETRKMLRRMVGEDIVLTTSLEPDIGHVRVDPGYLVQVLMNLAVNARDAMPRGGTLSITTRNTTIEAAHAQFHPRAKQGPAVVLVVTDTGVGMPPDVLARIFEPFFTTKPHGRGTGMGLAVVHGIIEQAGGLIEVESRIGGGATFRIYLPVVDEQVAPAAEIAGSLARGSERILLVDDDEHVRRSAARALRARGYDVVEASTGAAALAHLDGADLFDVLLTDVVMPTMDGRQLAEAAQARCPALRTIYMSGYADDAVVRHGVMQGQVELIEKPFRIDGLAMRVRQVLDRPQPAESAGDLQGSQGVSCVRRAFSGT